MKASLAPALGNSTVHFRSCAVLNIMKFFKSSILSTHGLCVPSRLSHP
jgi:hypothetical protein